MSRAETASPAGQQKPVLSQLRGMRDVQVFMIALAVSTGVGVSISAWYVTYLRQEFGTAGVGAMATTYAVVLALCAFPAGMVVDRFRAERLLLPCMALLGAVSFGAGLLLARGSAPLFTLLTACALEALVFGVLALAVVKSQAALVPAESRGAVSLLHLAVVAVGGVGGVVWSTWRHGSLWDFGLLVVVDVAVGLAYRHATRHLMGSTRQRHVDLRAGFTLIMTNVRSGGSFRVVLLANLALAFVLPTQMLNLYVADSMHEHLVAPLFIGSFLAVAAGSAFLLARGLRRGVDRVLRWSFVGYAVILAVAIPVVRIDTSTLRDAALVVIAVVGIFMLVVGQGMLNALFQQMCPDEVRGRVTGTISAARKALVAVGVTMATAVSVYGDTSALIATYLVLIGLLLILVKGFRSVADV